MKKSHVIALLAVIATLALAVAALLVCEKKNGLCSNLVSKAKKVCCRKKSEASDELDETESVSEETEAVDEIADAE